MLSSLEGHTDPEHHHNRIAVTSSRITAFISAERNVWIDFNGNKINKAEISDIIEVSAADTTIYALDLSGVVWVLSFNYNRVSHERMEGIPPIRALSTSDKFEAFVTQDNELYARKGRKKPHKILVPNVCSVSASSSYLFILCFDGSCYIMGKYSYVVPSHCFTRRQILYLPQATNDPSCFKFVSASNVIAIEAVKSTVCFILSDRTVVVLSNGRLKSTDYRDVKEIFASSNEYFVSTLTEVMFASIEKSKSKNPTTVDLKESVYTISRGASRNKFWIVTQEGNLLTLSPNLRVKPADKPLARSFELIPLSRAKSARK